MANFKYRLREIEIGDTSTTSGTKTTVTSIDPDSGAIEWDVEKVADFESVFDTLAKASIFIDQLISSPEAKNDFKLRAIAAKVREAYNEYRTNLRKNYPEIMARIKTLSEESTISSTSGFTSGGTGENYQSKNAFGQAKKNAKSYYQVGYKPVSEFKYKLKKTIKEDNTDVETYLRDSNINEPSKKIFISSRLLGFDQVEKKLNELIPLLQQAKHKTLDYYKQNPDSYSVVYGTDLAQDYLNDLIELFKD